MNNSAFGKTMENTRRHRDIKLRTTGKKKKNCLVSEPNYHTTKIFTENVLPIEMKKNPNINDETCLFRTANTRIK